MRSKIQGNLRSLVLALGVLAMSATFGGWRDLAQNNCSIGIPGAGGDLLGCYGQATYCGDGTWCIYYYCADLTGGGCGENSGDECTFLGLCEQIGVICAAPCP